jgi:glycosyltransferase involved in cell wall biosynthesis
MTPRFSIATPCFKSLKFLPSCVGSIRGQVGVTLEHLVQDGASPDGTAAWLASQSGLNWQSEKDRGMYDAINKAWSRASGEIISWLNADEQYLPGTLALVDKTFRENPDADVVWGDTIIVRPDGEPVAARREIPLRGAYVRNGFLYALSCSIFFHCRLLDAGLLRFDESFKNAGDADLILRLLGAGKKFVHVPAYFSLFGVDGNNLTVAPGSRMEAEGVILRERYGALRQPLLRKLVLLGRYAERAAAGCYKPANLAYDFALNEKPDYRHVQKNDVTARFSYETAVPKN